MRKFRDYNKCEIFAKRFFLFAGNSNPCLGDDISRTWKLIEQSYYTIYNLGFSSLCHESTHNIDLVVLIKYKYSAPMFVASD